MYNKVIRTATYSKHISAESKKISRPPEKTSHRSPLTARRSEHHTNKLAPTAPPLLKYPMMNETYETTYFDPTSYPHPPYGRELPIRHTTAYSDHGTIYIIDYRLTKRDGLEYLRCHCPGAEKEYFCRHLKDFISGEFHFYRDMNEREKARIRKLLPDKRNYRSELETLYPTVIEVREIEKKLATIQADVDEEMEHALRWAVAESKLRHRAGSERRWQYMETALERVMDKLDWQAEEWGTDLITQHLELEEERRTHNRALHRLVPHLGSPLALTVFYSDKESEQEKNTDE